MARMAVGSKQSAQLSPERLAISVAVAVILLVTFSMVFAGPTLAAGLLLISALIASRQIALLLALTSGAFGFLFAVNGIDLQLLTFAQTGLVSLAVVNRLVTQPHGAPKQLAITLIILTLALPALLVGLFELGTIQSLNGLRVILLPFLVYVAASQANPALQKRWLDMTLCVIVTSFFVALWQVSLGVDRLIVLGATYGTTITNIGSQVRAPGLFPNSFHLGLFSATYCAIVLSRYLVLRRAEWHHIAIGLPASLGCIVLSTSRTSLLLIAGTVVGATIMAKPEGQQSRRSTLRTTLAIGALSVAAYAFVTRGAAGSESTFARFARWSEIGVSLIGHPFGYGLGSAGVASASRYSDTKVFVDNYFLSVAYQMGVIGILAFLALAFAILRSLASARSSTVHKDVSVLLFALLLASLFLEVWDYPSSMILLAGYVAFRTQPAKGVALGVSSHKRLAVAEGRRKRPSPFNPA